MMKNTVRNIIISAAAILIALPMYAINYPTYKGQSVERNAQGKTLDVPLRADPLPKPTAVGGGNGYSLQNNNGTASGSMYLGSDKRINSYGGGSAQGGSGSSIARGGSRAGATGGSVSGGASFTMPRMQSVAKGSSFESDEATILADGYAPETSETFASPPPPYVKDMNGDGKVDETDWELWKQAQLPLGDGIGLLLLLAIGYVVRKKD